jgi:hypothetical protein
VAFDLELSRGPDGRCARPKGFLGSTSIMQAIEEALEGNPVCCDVSEAC